MRSFSFWMAVTGLVLVSAAGSAVLQHTYLFLDREMRIGAPFAAEMLSSTFGLGLIAKVAAGKVFDSFSIAGMTAWHVLLAVSIAMAFATKRNPDAVSTSWATRVKPQPFSLLVRQAADRRPLMMKPKKPAKNRPQ